MVEFNPDIDPEAPEAFQEFDSLNAQDNYASELDGLIEYLSSQFPVDAIPSGMVTMWSGDVSNIPDGWTLCDGSGGAPDLRNKFVVGANGDYSVGDTGGSEQVTLSESEMPSHSHSANGNTSNTGSHSHNISGNTSNTGSHSHNVSGNTSNTGSHTHEGTGQQAAYVTDGSTLISEASVTVNNSTTSTDGSHSHNVSGNTSNTGSHSHNVSGNTSNTGSHSHNVSVSVGSSGAGDAHENRPPYYSLAYIMKL